MDLFQEVLQEIECPICLQYMIPPIEICLNGHNICKDCRHNIETCPFCRSRLINTRNLTAESMSRLITHPCVNKVFGCTGQLLLDFKEKHEKKCLFRPIVCPGCSCQK
ncbi:E3 ubiquitin-protein ligase sina [Blattella germanica]|nr:E3 ubiquitin-protein ligase sina [Blattella germanica]